MRSFRHLLRNLSLVRSDGRLETNMDYSGLETFGGLRLRNQSLIFLVDFLYEPTILKGRLLKVLR